MHTLTNVALVVSEREREREREREKGRMRRRPKHDKKTILLHSYLFKIKSTLFDINLNTLFKPKRTFAYQ